MKLEARGGGLTAGKSTIEDGTGEFSNVKNIDEIFGSYANAEAHAGAVKSSGAQAMTKGEVSLALAAPAAAGTSASPSASSRSSAVTRFASGQRFRRARLPEAGRELRAEQEDLRRVIQPQQQRGE